MPIGMPYPVVSNATPAPWESPILPPYAPIRGPVAEVFPQLGRVAPPMPVYGGFPGSEVAPVNPMLSQITPPAPMYNTSMGAYRAVDMPVVPPAAPTSPIRRLDYNPVSAAAVLPGTADSMFGARPGTSPEPSHLTSPEAYNYYYPEFVNLSVAEMAPLSLVDYVAPPENRQGDAILAASPEVMRPRAMMMRGGGGGVAAPAPVNVPNMMPMPATGTVAPDMMMRNPQPTRAVPGAFRASDLPMLRGSAAPSRLPRSMAMNPAIPPVDTPMPAASLSPMAVPPSMTSTIEYMPPPRRMPMMRQPQDVMLPGGINSFVGLRR